MIPAFGYIRVSSDAQATDDRTSLEDQRAAIAALAARQGAEVLQVFSDPGVSGATVARRPGLNALIARCRAEKRRTDQPGFVFILNDSRLGRFEDPDEAAHLRFTLKQLGWVVKFAEADDIADPSLRHIMRAIGSAQASEYRRNLRANSTRGRMGTAKQGYWTGRPPYGYERAVVYPSGRERVLPAGTPKAKDERIKLTPGCAFEVQVVQDLFAMYASGAYSLRALERWVLKQVPSPEARRLRWCVPVLTVLLRNPAYLGHTGGRWRTAARMEHGDYGRNAAPEYLVRDTHPALIDQATFDRVQELMGEIPPRGNNHDYRVRGLVHCAACGEPYVGGGTATLKEGTRGKFYIDRGGRDGICPPPRGCISTHVLERAVIEGLSAHLAGQLTDASIRAAFDSRMALTTHEPKDPRVAIARALDVARTRRDNLVAAVEAGTLLAAEVRDRLEAVRREIHTLEYQLAEQQALHPSATTVSHSLDRLVALARNFIPLAETATGPELRAMLRPWMDRMTFDRRTRVLTMRMHTLAGLLVPTLQAAN